MFGTRTRAPAVVVADDDPAMRGLLSHALRDAGYAAYTAMDIREAIGQVRRPGVVAAIVDMLFVNSGGQSGLDLLRFIRRHARLSDLPVIVLTGFSLNRTVVAELDACRGELWHKPVDPIEITDRLAQLISPPPPIVERTSTEPERRAVRTPPSGS